ncbi:hypothetical protein BFJ63_vAg6664 [Fusarium oxysporum f. sp. narcissi]|uniref:Uncharacterized protein n=1 Tax=Fusarium oxysporum f. sp. narcissi TaxID=451672 RepID=A0A4Q2VUS8_FUSOX|nr:hypothetical protein BFJ63_vAg6664 [Fusarium oxysporum f. sp. narcissi]
MVVDKNPNDPRTYVLMRYLNDLSSVAGSVCDGSSRPATPKSNASEELVEDVASLNTSKIKYLGLKVTNNNRTEPASSIPLVPDNISGARTDRNFSTEPAGSSRKNEKVASSTRGTSRLSYVPTNHRQLLPPKLSPVSKGFRGCTLSPDGTKLLWRDKRYMLLDVNSGEVNEVDPKPPRLSLTNFIIETLKVEILTTGASLFLASVKTTAGRFWMFGDRSTGEWTRQMGCPDPVTPCCILSLSQHSAPFVQLSGSDGASIVKVIKATSPEGNPKVAFSLKVVKLKRSFLRSRAWTTLSLPYNTLSVPQSCTLESSMRTGLLMLI